MKVEHAIHIEAPQEVVWAVTTDVERWPEWAPAVTSVRRVDEGPFGKGSTALIKQQALPETPWSVTSFVHGERFSWETRTRGLHMVATHELEPAGSGTVNRLRVEAAGWPARLFGPLLRLVMQRALADENRNLKALCEARVTA